MKKPVYSLCILFSLALTACEIQEDPAKPQTSQYPISESAEIPAKRIADLDALQITEKINAPTAITAASLPEEMNAIGSKTPITLTFDREMENYTVEEAFSITPSVPGKFSWEGTTMSFTPDQPYEAGKNYRVTLSQGALDKTGKNLPEKFSRRFEVTDELKILAITPQGTVGDPEADISIIFNKPVFELGTIDELEKHDFGILIEPPFPFRYRLVGTTTLQIQGKMPADRFGDKPSLFEGETIEHRLPRSAEISITVPETFAAIDGSTLKLPRTFTVKTPRIALLTQSIGEINPFMPAQLSFNVPVDIDDAKKKITVADKSGNVIKTVIDYHIDDDGKLVTNRVEIKPANGFWEYDTPYELRVAEGIFATEGNLSTQEGVNIPFHTQAFVALETDSVDAYAFDGVNISTSPVHGEDSSPPFSKNPSVGPNSSLTLVFDQPPVSLNEIRNSLSIPDAPAFNTAYQPKCKDPELRNSLFEEDCETIEDTRRVTITFVKPLQNNREYRIKISQGLRAALTPDDERPYVKIEEGWKGKTWQNPKPAELGFQVVPPAIVIGHYAANNAYKEFCLFSETPFDVMSAKTALSFTPALPDPEKLELQTGRIYKQPTSENGIFGCNHHQYAGKYFLRVMTGLEFEKEYKISLNSETEDVYRQKLEKQYAFTHRTGPLLDEDITLRAISPGFFAAPLKSAPVVTFLAENLPQGASIDICQVSAEQLLTKENRLYAQYSDQKWLPDKGTCKSFTEDSIKTTKGPWQQEVLEVPLQKYFGEQVPAGLYVVAAHHPRVNDIVYERGLLGNTTPVKVPRYTYSVAEVTDLALVTKHDAGKLYAWVSRMSDGKDVADAEIIAGTLSYGIFGLKPELEETILGNTGNDGTLFVDLPANQQFQYLIARVPGTDEVISHGFFAANDYSRNGLARAYILTDRGLYRPGETINGKAILALDKDAAYTPPLQTKALLSARDQNGGLFLEKQRLELNTLGAAEFTVSIPKDTPLGNISIEICTEAREPSCFYQSVAIEEYKKPEFTVDIVVPENTQYQGNEVLIGVNAAYYFGLPLKGGTGSYTIKRENYRFDRFTAIQGYIFGQDSTFQPVRHFSIWPPYQQTEYLKTEEITLDEDGKKNIFEVVSLPYLQSSPKDNPKDKLISLKPVRQNKTYIAEATIADSNEVPVYAEARFTALATTQFVGIKADKPSMSVGEALPLKLIVVNGQGKPLPEAKAKLTIIHREQVRDTKADSGKNRFSEPRSHIEEKIIYSEDFVMDESGKADYEHKIDSEKPGHYRIIAETRDKNNQLQRTEISFYAYKEDSPQESLLQSEEIELIPDKTLYTVGETANITVVSPLDLKKSRFLVARERETLHEISIVNFEKEPVIQIPITAEMVPNIFISAIGQEFGENPRLASGAVDLKINREAKELKIKVETDKADYLPGETVHLKIRNRNNLPAEFAVVVADKANLDLLENARQHILDFFYAPRENLTQAVMTLLDVRLRDTAQERLSQGGDFAGGMGSPARMGEIAEDAAGGGESLSSKTMPPIGAPMPSVAAGGNGNSATVKKRSDFKSTAFFQGIVASDDEGKARLSFQLPDNITEWEALVIAVDKAYNAGEQKFGFVSKKPLLIRPQLPRFLRSGDEIIVRADITNGTDITRNVTVVLNTENVEISSEYSQSVELAAGVTKAVDFAVNAKTSQPGSIAAFTFSAADNDYRDDVVQKVPILRLATPETVASSGVVSDTSFFEKVRLPKSVINSLGELKIKVGATAANYLNSGLMAIVESPYASNAGNAERVMALLTYYKAISLPNFKGHLAMPDLKDGYGNTITFDQALEEAVVTLTKRQRYDGSWGYYPEAPEGNPFLTAEIIKVLQELKANKISFSEKTLWSASEYLYGYLSRNEDLRDTEGKIKYSSQADNRALLLSALSAFPEMRPRLAELTKELNSYRYLLSVSGNLAFLGHLQNISEYEEERKAIIDELAKKLEIDPRGMFLNGDSGGCWPYFDRGSAHEYTARYLKALIREESGSLYDHPYIPRIMKWLIASRENGRWQNSRATVAALDAFVDFLTKSGEHLAEFEASVHADGREIESFHVDGKTLFDTHEIIITTADVVERGSEGLLLQFLKEGDEKGALYYDLILSYFLPVKDIAAREEGMSIRRELFPVEEKKQSDAVTSGKIGEVLKGKITVTVPSTRRFVIVDSPLPAGTELINFRLKTSDKRFIEEDIPHPLPYAEGMSKERDVMIKPNGIMGEAMGSEETSIAVAPAPMPNKAPDEAVGFAPPRPAIGMAEPAPIPPPMIDMPSGGAAVAPYGGGGFLSDQISIWNYSPWDHKEMRDDRLLLYADQLDPGVYEYEFFLRVTHEGQFAFPPAHVGETHFPEVFGRTAGSVFDGKADN